MPTTLVIPDIIDNTVWWINAGHWIFGFISGYVLHDFIIELYHYIKKVYYS